ncbi:MAG: hypothetical protein C0503_12015, partial [Gemmatimonas sp.]|nr:hypothetical protein [Gemmatimonas sp.]
NEILRALIALMGLQQPGEELKQVGKAFKNPLKNIGAISSYVTGRAKRTITKNKFTKVHEALADEADLVETAIHDLALAVEKALIEHGKDIIERQMIQERMANSAIDIYLSTAVLSRATTAIKKHGVDGAKDDLDAAKIFIAMAMRRARRAIRAIEKNQDDRLRALAKRAYDTGDLTVPTPTDT